LLVLSLPQRHMLVRVRLVRVVNLSALADTDFILSTRQ